MHVFFGSTQPPQHLWTEVLYELYQKSDPGIRESLLKEAHRLLGEEEARSARPS